MIRIDQPQADDGRVCDRERQHRPERVHVPEEVGLPRNQRQAGDAPEDQDSDPGCPEPGVQLAQPVRELAVKAHRVDEPGDSDDSGVGGDEEDRGCQQTNVDLAGVLERPQVEVLDDPQDRIPGEAALILSHAEQRLAAAGVAANGEGRERHHREGGVDGKDSDHHAVDRRRDRP